MPIRFLSLLPPPPVNCWYMLFFPCCRHGCCCSHHRLIVTFIIPATSLHEPDADTISTCCLFRHHHQFIVNLNQIFQMAVTADVTGFCDWCCSCWICCRRLIVPPVNCWFSIVVLCNKTRPGGFAKNSCCDNATVPMPHCHRMAEQHHCHHFPCSLLQLVLVNCHLPLVSNKAPQRWQL